MVYRVTYEQGIHDETTRLLKETGLTQLQIKIYLTLLKLGKMEAGELVKNVVIARPEAYRALDELQKRGLVEKEISRPYKFKATSLKRGLKILMLQRLQQYEDIQKKAKALLQKIQENKEETPQKEDYTFTIIEGREKIIQTIMLQHDKMQRNVKILSTAERWLQIVQYAIENYRKALRKGINYRIIIEKPNFKIDDFIDLKDLMTYPNFEMRVSTSSLKTNAAIFDEQEVSVTIYPSKLLKESPILITRHPSFVSMCQDHFENVWASAEKYQFEN